MFFVGHGSVRLHHPDGGEVLFDEFGFFPLGVGGILRQEGLAGKDEAREDQCQISECSLHVRKVIKFEDYC